MSLVGNRGNRLVGKGGFVLREHELETVLPDPIVDRLNLEREGGGDEGDLGATSARGGDARDARRWAVGVF